MLHVGVATAAAGSSTDVVVVAFPTSAVVAAEGGRRRRCWDRCLDNGVGAAVIAIIARLK